MTSTSTSERYLGVDAGPFRLALPLSSVRQILDVGGGEAPLQAHALGVAPISLAALLDVSSQRGSPAMLLLDGQNGATVLTCCALHTVLHVPRILPLPATVACRWPGLIHGVVDDAALTLVLDPRVLVGLIEAFESAAGNASVVDTHNHDDVTAVRGPEGEP